MSKEQDSLTSKISEKMAMTRSLGVTEDTGLEDKLASALSQNQAAKSAVSNPDIDTTAIITDLLQTADQFHITATPLYADEWDQVTVLGSSYYMLPIDIDLSGTLTNINGFIWQIENSEEFTSVTIDMLKLSGPDIAQINMDESINESPITAELYLSVIYRESTPEDEEE